MTQDISANNLRLNQAIANIPTLPSSGSLRTPTQGNREVVVLNPQRENTSVFVKLIRAISSICSDAVTSLVKAMSKVFTSSNLEREAERQTRNYHRITPEFNRVHAELSNFVARNLRNSETSRYQREPQQSVQKSPSEHETRKAAMTEQYFERLKARQENSQYGSEAYEYGNW